MNATVDPDLVKAVQQDFVALKNDVDKLAFEKEEERQQLQTALLCIITAVEKLDRRVSKIEEDQQLMEDDQRSLTTPEEVPLTDPAFPFSPPQWVLFPPSQLVWCSFHSSF